MAARTPAARCRHARGPGGCRRERAALTTLSAALLDCAAIRRGSALHAAGLGLLAGGMSAAAVAPAPDSGVAPAPAPAGASGHAVRRAAPPSAEERFRRAMDIRVRMFGPDDASVGEMCNTIALRLKAEKKLDEAVSYFERAVRIRETALGASDPDTLLSRGNLAEALMQRADQADATRPTPAEGIRAHKKPAKKLTVKEQDDLKKKQKAERTKKAEKKKKAGGPATAQPESPVDARARELRRALDILRDVGSKQAATLGTTNPYTLYTQANEWLALTKQPVAVPADFAGAHAELVKIRAAQVAAHGDGDLSPYVQRTDAHIKSVLEAREAWLRAHPVYTSKQLEEMNVKDVVKIACKLLGKKESVLRKMGAGLSITQDEVIQLVMNSPQQVTDRQLLKAAPTVPISQLQRPLSARKPAPPAGAAPDDSPRHTPRSGATAATPVGSGSAAVKVDAWVSPSRDELRVREAARRRLAVTVLECTDLPKANLVGQNDVYVELSLDGDKAARTSVVEDGGATPIWGAGGGQTILLAPNPGTGRNSAISVVAERAGLSLPQKLQVDVMDKDIKGSDFIGRHTVDLAEVADCAGGSFDEDWCAEGWYELTNHKGAAAGKVRLVLRWAVPGPAPLQASDQASPAGESFLQHVLHGIHHHKSRPGSPAGGPPPAHAEDTPQWELRTTIIRCAGLPKMDRFGKNDVYVTATVEGVQSLRTATIENGGEAPVWTGDDGTLTQILVAAPAALGIRVFDEDVGSADVIGTAIVPLGPALHYSDGAKSKAGVLSSHQHSTRVEWEMPPTWLELSAPNAKRKGKSFGRVQVQIVWQLASRSPPVKHMRPWTPEQAHFWATDTSRRLEDVDSFEGKDRPAQLAGKSVAVGEHTAEQKPDSADGNAQATEEDAATKIQSVERGRQGRKKATAKRTVDRQNRAATKIQAHQRGKQTRTKRKSKGNKVGPRGVAQGQDVAATKIQAQVRGRQVRCKRKQAQEVSRRVESPREAGGQSVSHQQHDSRRNVPSNAEYELEPEVEERSDPSAVNTKADTAADAELGTLRSELQGLDIEALRERALRDGVSVDRIASTLTELEAKDGHGGLDVLAAQTSALIELIMDCTICRQDHDRLATIEQEIAEAGKTEHGVTTAEAIAELEKQRRAAAVKIQARARGRVERRRYRATIEKRNAAGACIESTVKDPTDTQQNAEEARQTRLAHLRQEQ